jgi:hypothetical protein
MQLDLIGFDNAFQSCAVRYSVSETMAYLNSCTIRGKVAVFNVVDIAVITIRRPECAG